MLIEQVLKKIEGQQPKYKLEKPEGIAHSYEIDGQTVVLWKGGSLGVESLQLYRNLDDWKKVLSQSSKDYTLEAMTEQGKKTVVEEQDGKKSSEQTMALDKSEPAESGKVGESKGEQAPGVQDDVGQADSSKGEGTVSKDNKGDNKDDGGVRPSSDCHKCGTQHTGDCPKAMEADVKKKEEKDYKDTKEEDLSDMGKKLAVLFPDIEKGAIKRLAMEVESRKGYGDRDDIVTILTEAKVPNPRIREIVLTLVRRKLVR